MSITTGCMPQARHRATALAVPFAVLLGRYRFPGRGLIRAGIMIPLLLPPFAGAVAVKQFLGRYGSLNLLLQKIGLLDQPLDFLGSGFAGVVLHPGERPPTDVVAATRLWVRKEAVLKALGNGLNVDPRTLRLADPHLPPAVLAWPDPRPPGVVQMRDLDAPDGYLAALATIGGRGMEYTQVSIRAVRSASV